MKTKKIIYILIFFVIAMLFLTNVSFGFEDGDKVKTTIKSFVYDGIKYQDTITKFDRSDSGEYFLKDTILTYIRDMHIDNVCKVKYNGKEYYIKEVNLTSAGKNEEDKGGLRTDYDVVGFEKGNKVKCDIKSYHYYFDANTKSYQRKGEDQYFNKGTELIYIRMANKPDGICQVEYNGNTYYVKEVNLKEVVDSSGKIENDGDTTGDYIYKQPEKTSSGDSSESTLDDMVSDADNFVNDPNAELTYDTTKLQNFSKSLYNIAVVIGIFVAVIVGGIIGIKLMSSNIESQVEAKKLLVPYFIGCIVVFGGFIIWRLLVTILQTV